MAADCDRYVVLKGGLALPIAPVLLALDLERRGFTLERDDQDIFISPYSKLTDDDRSNLKAWKQHVLALIDYVQPERVQ